MKNLFTCFALSTLVLSANVSAASYSGKVTGCVTRTNGDIQLHTMGNTSCSSGARQVIHYSAGIFASESVKESYMAKCLVALSQDLSISTDNLVCGDVAYGQPNNGLLIRK